MLQKQVVNMKRRKCISCGNFIFKSSLFDPYLCRRCSHEEAKRYLYLDNGGLLWKAKE